MARKPRSETASSASAEGPSARDKIIEAFFDLLAEQRFEEIGLGEVAARAGVSLADFRGLFGSTFDIIAAHAKDIDHQVLAGGDGDMAEESPRERLFDILMRRIEALQSRKAAVRSLMRSARCNPALALGLNQIAVRSQQWMLTAADVDASGPRGVVRAQGLAVLFGSVLRVWVNDDDPGLARTMAALDRELARGARWAGLLNDLCRLAPSRFFTRRRAARGRGGEGPEETPLTV